MNPILSHIESPADLRMLSRTELPALAAELRDRISRLREELDHRVEDDLVADGSRRAGD